MGDSHKLAGGPENAHKPGLEGIGWGGRVGEFTQASRRFGECTQVAVSGYRGGVGGFT